MAAGPVCLPRLSSTLDEEAGMDGACRAREGAPGQYQPRRPSQSVLYRCVQQHLGTWLAHSREGHDDEGR